MRALSLLSLLWALSTSLLFGNTLRGLIVDQVAHPVHQAKVALLELRRQTAVSKDGTFSFSDVPAGTYHLLVTSQEFGSKNFEVIVTEGEETQHTLALDVAFHDEIVVSGGLANKSTSDLTQAISVLNNENLIQRIQPSLGETLANQPGMSSTYAGPAASRPMIRGLGGDRIAILEGGLASGDVSSLSGDHAVAIDPSGAERIEILRGPASLRYGSSAVGGAVNVVDNRIPELISSDALTGSVELRGNTVSDQQALSANLGGGQGRLAWHSDFSFQEAEDTKVPGYANQEEEEEGDPEHKGLLENSAFENKKGSLGFSYITERGFLGAAYTQLDSLYGIPGGHGHEEEDHEEDGDDQEEEEEAVKIDLAQKRLELRGELKLASNSLKALNFRFANADYEHQELEGGEIGTSFLNDQSDLRMEVTHNTLGFFDEGSFGTQWSDRDFEAIGDEAFVPPNTTEKLAAFVYEEIAKGSFRYVLGGRFDHQTNDTDGFDGASVAMSKNFNTVSASTGFVWKHDTGYSVASNLTHTERAPAAEELFSNGPHLATGAYQVGNPDLKIETSLGVDVSLRKHIGRVTGELNLFTNSFDDFIFEQYTGEQVEDLDEYHFVQNQADLVGGELHVHIELLHQDPHHLDLDLFYDTVSGELDGGEYLPRITPSRLGVRLDYQTTHFHTGIEARETKNQNELAVFETETEGFTFLNVDFGYHFLLGTSNHKITLRGTNLTDREGRVHTSFFKDRTMLPGRNLDLIYRVNF